MMDEHEEEIQEIRRMASEEADSAERYAEALDRQRRQQEKDIKRLRDAGGV